MICSPVIEKDRSNAAHLSAAERRFQDMIDELFSYTRKKIDRKRNDIAFYQDGELLFPYKLSSGEKQMLVILLTVLVQDNSHCVLFMDEPEASLHIEWPPETYRHDSRTESQCTDYSDDPFAGCYHGRLAGCRYRGK